MSPPANPPVKPPARVLGYIRSCRGEEGVTCHARSTASRVPAAGLSQQGESCECPRLHMMLRERIQSFRPINLHWRQCLRSQEEGEAVTVIGRNDAALTVVCSPQSSTLQSRSDSKQAGSG